MTSIDSRDIHHIAAGAETVAKVLRDRGERAWKRAAEFDPGARTSRPADAATGGTRIDQHDEHDPDSVSADLAGLPVLANDPVGEAVIAGGELHHSERRALARDLTALDAACQRVLDRIDSITRTKTAIPPDDPRGWCPNCKRADVTEPSAMRDDGSQRFRDRDGRCRPCIRFREEHGFDRPPLIIQRKAEGRKLSKQEADQAIARARREHELDQRKAAARAARRAAEDADLDAEAS